MKNRFFIYTMILMGSLFAACEEDLKPYAEDTCWVYFDLIGSADTLQSRTFVMPEAMRKQIQFGFL